MRTALIPPVLALAWGLNWPAVKTMLAVVPPFSLRLLGLGLGALLMLALAAWQRRPLAPPRQAWGFVVVGGLLTIGLFNICVALAQLSTSTARAAVLTFTMPMVSAVLAWALLGERLDRRGLAALALGGAGVAVLAWPVLRPWLEVGAAPAASAAAGAGPAAPGAARPALAGLLLPLTAALCWSLGTVATKRWPPVGDRLVLTAWQLLVGAALTGAGAWLLGEQVPPAATWPARVWVALAFHVLVATMVAYVLWYRLLSELSATVSSLTTLAVPVVGVLGAMVLVGDRPSGADWLGFALVLGGAALAVLKIGTAPPARALR